MNETISMMGLGRLGLPIILAIESQGFKVIGYDVNKELCDRIKHKQDISADVNSHHLKKSSLKIVDLPNLVALSDILFVCVQTPHDRKYEGITLLPDERKDFCYSYLKEAIANILREVSSQNLRNKVIAIMSTVLPGTIDREILPLTQFASGEERIHLVYNPQFPAMGTVKEDFLITPEFVLLGGDNEQAIKTMKNFYEKLYRFNPASPPIVTVPTKTAELVKVSYNTYISMKIGFVNTLMEVCHKMEINVDDVTDTLKLANKRLISAKYMDGGGPDSGGCHPRDNIALSYLAKKLNLSYDWFEAVMMARQRQVEWFADMIIQMYHYHNGQLPVVILGKAYKPETTMQEGSFGLFLDNMLLAKGFKKHTVYDPYFVKGEKVSNFTEPLPFWDDPSIFFIATKHEVFRHYQYPMASVVFDPFGYIDNQENVEVIRIGR